MSTAVVLFTRDLRVHDHPALHAAVRSASHVVPLFVVDDALVTSLRDAANRWTLLLAGLHDLRRSLAELGGTLVVRRGVLAAEVAAVCREVGATSLHVGADVSAYARRREQQLGAVADALRIALHLHPGVTVVEPGALAAAGRDHFQVFTPYWRRWREAPRRRVLPAPTRVRVPAGLRVGRIPARARITDVPVSPQLPDGGERAARRALDAWLAGGVDAYHERRDLLAADATSRLSPHLHLGCLSPTEVLSRLDLRRPGHDAYARQLCWRDLHHQLLWATPTLVEQDLRPRGDVWREDPDALDAWRAGRTGYPIVDAGMRQLRREGWMHNRARMIVASFLTKHLYLDWRHGAEHFARWLADGDVASNWASWQWVAGTGTDTRPNRVLSPISQARRYDPDAAYIRRELPELADVPTAELLEPTRAGAGPLAEGYPPPIVDHAGARERFLAARRPDRTVDGRAGSSR